MSPAELQTAIKEQGEVVRGLKAAKADKSKIDDAVGKLLALKARLGPSEPETKRSKERLKCAKGTQDFGPKAMALRHRVFDLITDTFKRHGAETIDTPVFEFTEVLLGKYGEEGGKLVYKLEDQGGELLSLRYDLTVPFARYLAMNKIKALKRYHIAKDFDIAGTYDPLLPEAECVKMVDEVLGSLGLGPYTIRVNHRRLLDGMFAAAGVPPCLFKSVCSTVDKLDKTPWAEVYREMIVDKGLGVEAAERLEAWLVGDARDLASLRRDKDLAANPDALAAMGELEVLLDYCKLLNIGSVEFEPSLARGLDYYTGVIFEAVVDSEASKARSGEAEESAVGSIAGGGRYDGLVESFAKGHRVPCVGVSLGIERIFSLMEQKAKREGEKVRTTETEVYVASAHKGLVQDRLRVAQLLWDAQIKTEMPYKGNPKLLDQLQLCEDRQIPLAIILGADELARGVLKLRDIETREETEVKRDGIVSEIRSRLASKSKA